MAETANHGEYLNEASIAYLKHVGVHTAWGIQYPTYALPLYTYRVNLPCLPLEGGWY